MFCHKINMVRARVLSFHDTLKIKKKKKKKKKYINFRPPPPFLYQDFPVVFSIASTNQCTGSSFPNESKEKFLTISVKFLP